MDYYTASVIAAIVLAIVLLVFFVRYGRKVRFSIKTMLGEASAEGGEKRSESDTSGINIANTEVGRNLRATSKAEGGVKINKVKAKGDLTASHQPPHQNP